jgi:S-(hydroxymethyl)glutathione dehydrogenase/alcohol dehydrogenase
VKAAVLREIPSALEIDDVQIDGPGPREVLINTAAAGVCHSDLHFMEGLYPYPTPAVLGHESAGVVEAVGSDVTYVKPATTSSPACRCSAAAASSARRGTRAAAPRRA